MSLVKNDHVIETLAANATNHPFDIRILPRRARRRPNLVDAEAFDAPDEVRTIDAIVVPQQIARRGFPWKGVDELLRRPLSTRVVGDVEVNDTAAIVTKDDEDAGEPLRWGILGAARIAGKTLVPAMRLAGDEVVAVAASSARRARDFAESHGIELMHNLDPGFAVSGMVGGIRSGAMLADLIADPEYDDQFDCSGSSVTRTRLSRSK